MWFPRCIFLHWISGSVTGFVLEFGDKLGGVVHLWKQSQWVFGMQPRVLILLMKEILHQLIGSLSHYLKGFIHPRWLFGISSINSMSRLFGHLFIAWSAYFLMYIASFNQVMCFGYHFGTKDLRLTFLSPVIIQLLHNFWTITDVISSFPHFSHWNLSKWWVQWFKWAVCWLGGPTRLCDHQGVWVVEGASWWTGGQEFQSPEAFRELVLRCPMVLETWVRKLLVTNLRLDVQHKCLARYSKLAGQCANFAKFCVVLSLIRWIFLQLQLMTFFVLSWIFTPKIPKNPKKPSIFYRKILFSTRNIEELSFNCGYSCSAACSRCWCPAMTRIKKVTATWGVMRRLCGWNGISKVNKPQDGRS